MKAIWNNQILAESSQIIVIDNNYYFPTTSLNLEYFTESETTTICPWKGTASYYTLEVDGEKNEDAAWYYPSPKEAANEIKNHVAFWRGVNIS